MASLLSGCTGAQLQGSCNLAELFNILRQQEDMLQQWFRRHNRRNMLDSHRYKTEWRSSQIKQIMVPAALPVFALIYHFANPRCSATLLVAAASTGYALDGSFVFVDVV